MTTPATMHKNITQSASNTRDCRWSRCRGSSQLIFTALWRCTRNISLIKLRSNIALLFVLSFQGECQGKNYTASHWHHQTIPIHISQLFKVSELTPRKKRDGSNASTKCFDIPFFCAPCQDTLEQDDCDPNHSTSANMTKASII